MITGRPDAFIKIPRERVGVLIGPEGKVKSYIEQNMHVTLEVDHQFCYAPKTS